MSSVSWTIMLPFPFVSSFFGVSSEFHHASYYMCVVSKVLILGLAPVIMDLEFVATMALALR